MKARSKGGIVGGSITLAAFLLAAGCGSSGDGVRSDTPDPEGTLFERAPSSAPAPGPVDDGSPGTLSDGSDREGPECSGFDPEYGNIIYAGSQAEIDALASCEVITGALWIETGPGSDPDLDLRPLRALRSIGMLAVLGWIGFDGVPTGIRSLEGFENLQELTGELWLVGLRITTLAPLRNLRVPKPDGPNYTKLQVLDCDDLETLDGLELGPDLGVFSIGDNDRLTTLDALKLDRAPRSLYHIGVGNNPRLLDLDVFATVTDLTSLSLSRLPQTELTAFEALRRVSESFALTENGVLTTATFPNLESVGTLSI